jgi:hypothetical protein
MIYFIRTVGRPYVKIGFCGGDPVIRMAGLQVGAVDQLELMGASAGGPSDERAWHQRFDHLRARGEWFELTPELLKAIGLALAHDKPRGSDTELALAYLNGDTSRQGDIARRRKELLGTGTR